MRRFSSDRFNLRARPWLVLWLLPFLVMSVVASGHNHGFSVPATGHGHVHAVGEAAVHAVEAPIAAASETAHELWCLACQWAGFAAGLLSPAFVLLLVVGSLPVAALKLLSSRRAPARVAVRGPPAR